MASDSFSHLREDGSASMVDVGDKPLSRREAIARGLIRLQPETLAAIEANAVGKGSVLAVARIAGIQAAKQTSALIPLCHQLPLSKVDIDFDLEPEGIAIRCLARTTAPTGVEMEALTGVSVAALTIYDMCKAIDQAMVIEAITLIEKTKEPVSP